MIELRFHRELYAGEAVDEAVRRFARFGAFELVEEPSHWLVRFTAKTPARERAVAGELGNHALGASAQRRGAAR